MTPVDSELQQQRLREDLWNSLEAPEKRSLRPLIANAPKTTAIENLVFGLAHYVLWPLRQLSGWLSRSHRERH